MNIVNIIKLSNFILDKEFSGNVITPDQFNDLIAFVNQELFSEEYDKLVTISAQAGELLSRKLISLIDDSMLVPFKGSAQKAGNSEGVMDLPSDYKHKLAARMTATKTLQPLRYVTWVSEDEFIRKQTFISKKPISQYPCATIRDGEMHYLPAEAKSVTLIYLKNPTDPFLDWCVSNTSGETFPMNPTDKISNVAGTLNLIDADGDVIASDVWYYTTPAVGNTANSRSVDPEYDSMYFIRFVNRILEKAGLRIGDSKVFEYSQIAQKQGE